jgi:hypothetical protein
MFVRRVLLVPCMLLVGSACGQLLDLGGEQLYPDDDAGPRDASQQETTPNDADGGALECTIVHFDFEPMGSPLAGALAADGDVQILALRHPPADGAPAPPSFARLSLGPAGVQRTLLDDVPPSFVSQVSVSDLTGAGDAVVGAVEMDGGLVKGTFAAWSAAGRMTATWTISGDMGFYANAVQRGAAGQTALAGTYQAPTDFGAGPVTPMGQTAFVATYDSGGKLASLESLPAPWGAAVATATSGATAAVSFDHNATSPPIHLSWWAAGQLSSKDRPISPSSPQPGGAWAELHPGKDVFLLRFGDQDANLAEIATYRWDTFDPVARFTEATASASSRVAVGPDDRIYRLSWEDAAGTKRALLSALDGSGNAVAIGSCRYAGAAPSRFFVGADGRPRATVELDEAGVGFRAVDVITFPTP